MIDEMITDREMQDKLRSMKNFKSPGPDQIIHFWLKQVTALHPLYPAIFNHFLSDNLHSYDSAKA